MIIFTTVFNYLLLINFRLYFHFISILFPFRSTGIYFKEIFSKRTSHVVSSNKLFLHLLLQKQLLQNYRRIYYNYNYNYMI